MQSHALVEDRSSWVRAHEPLPKLRRRILGAEEVQQRQRREHGGEEGQAISRPRGGGRQTGTRGRLLSVPADDGKPAAATA